jgi:DNA-binding response OmpR family regulator
MRILLVEDQKKLAAHVARGLVEDGHLVDQVHDGEAAQVQGQALPYDVIVLDWSLPGKDGLAVLREWRSRGLRTPVLMLTARDTLEERVLALRSGADDHLGKPFAYDELLARLEALHRRHGHSDDRALGDVTMVMSRRVLRRGAGGSRSPAGVDAVGVRSSGADRVSGSSAGADEVELTAREWALLVELASHRGDVCSRHQLLNAVWGDDFDGSHNVVDVYVGYLRQKLQSLQTTTTTIATVRGIGYRLVVAP